MAHREISLPNKQYDEDNDILKTNRSGGATIVGGFYFLDEIQTATGSTNFDAGLGQILAVTTALMTNQARGVVASEIAANGDPVRVGEGDAIRCRIAVDGSGTAIAKGDKLKPVNGSARMVKATVATDRWYAIAGEASVSATGVIQGLLFSRPSL